MAKTLRLKKPEPTLTAKPVAAPGAEGEAPKEGAAAPAPAAEGGEQQGIFIAGRHRNPLEAAAAQPAKKQGSWAWAVPFGIAAFVLFALLLAVEWADWLALRHA